MNKVRFLGWEKYALDEKGKRYVKERFVFPDHGLVCGTLYTEVDGEYQTIYEIIGEQKVEIAKIYCEKDEDVIFCWEGMYGK